MRQELTRQRRDDEIMVAQLREEERRIKNLQNEIGRLKHRNDVLEEENHRMRRALDQRPREPIFSSDRGSTAERHSMGNDQARPDGANAMDVDDDPSKKTKDDKGKGKAKAKTSMADAYDELGNEELWIS